MPEERFRSAMGRRALRVFSFGGDDTGASARRASAAEDGVDARKEELKAPRCNLAHPLS